MDLKQSVEQLITRAAEKSVAYGYMAERVKLDKGGEYSYQVYKSIADDFKNFFEELKIIHSRLT